MGDEASSEPTRGPLSVILNACASPAEDCTATAISLSMVYIHTYMHTYIHTYGERSKVDMHITLSVYLHHKFIFSEYSQ